MYFMAAAQKLDNEEIVRDLQLFLERLHEELNSLQTLINKADVNDLSPTELERLGVPLNLLSDFREKCEAVFDKRRAEYLDKNPKFGCGHIVRYIRPQTMFTNQVGMVKRVIRNEFPYTYYEYDLTLQNGKKISASERDIVLLGQNK